MIFHIVCMTTTKDDDEDNDVIGQIEFRSNLLLTRATVPL